MLETERLVSIITTKQTIISNSTLDAGSTNPIKTFSFPNVETNLNARTVFKLTKTISDKRTAVDTELCDRYKVG